MRAVFAVAAFAVAANAIASPAEDCDVATALDSAKCALAPIPKQNPATKAEQDAMPPCCYESWKARQTTTEKPGPGTEKPGPGTEKPGPGTEKPGPGTEKPGPGTERPGPGTERPGPGTERPGPGTEKPGPGTEKPGPGTEKPGPGTEKPGPGKPCRGPNCPGKEEDKSYPPEHEDDYPKDEDKSYPPKGDDYPKDNHKGDDYDNYKKPDNYEKPSTYEPHYPSGGYKPPQSYPSDCEYNKPHPPPAPKDCDYGRTKGYPYPNDYPRHDNYGQSDNHGDDYRPKGWKKPSNDCAVYSPRHGQPVTCGKKHRFEWHGFKGKQVKLELVYGKGGDDCRHYTVISDSCDNNGHYDWDVPSDIPPTGGLYGYGLKVTCHETGDVYYSPQFCFDNKNFYNDYKHPACPSEAPAPVTVPACTECEAPVYVAPPAQTQEAAAPATTPCPTDVSVPAVAPAGNETVAFESSASGVQKSMSFIAALAALVAFAL